MKKSDYVEKLVEIARTNANKLTVEQLKQLISITRQQSTDFENITKQAKCVKLLTNKNKQILPEKQWTL